MLSYSDIWCLKTLRAPLVRVGYKWSQTWFLVSISCSSQLYLNISRKLVFVVHKFVPKFQTLDIKYILYLWQMQPFENRFSVCIIPAVCHNLKGPFLKLCYAFPFKTPICNSKLKVWKDQWIVHQFHGWKGQVRFKPADYVQHTGNFLGNLVCVSSNSCIHSL